MRSASSAPAATAMPPTMSEWPLRYLVAEWTTISAPCSIGRCSIGEQKVLSTTSSKSCFLANAESFFRSTSFSIGLVGVSAQIMRVFGFNAAFNAFASFKSMKLKSSPALRRRTRSNNR